MGRYIGCLKEKTPRQKIPHIRGSILPIPINILERYKDITLAGGILFINGIFFINTISRHLKFMVAGYIANAEAKTLQESIKSQTVLHVVGIKGNKHPCGQAINLHQK